MLSFVDHKECFANYAVFLYSILNNVMCKCFWLLIWSKSCIKIKDITSLEFNIVNSLTWCTPIAEKLFLWSRTRPECIIYPRITVIGRINFLLPMSDLRHYGRHQSKLWHALMYWWWGEFLHIKHILSLAYNNALCMVWPSIQLLHNILLNITF